MVNSVALSAVVPNASLRHSNVYLSSTDADFANHFCSSVPGIYLHTLRAGLLGSSDNRIEIGV